MGFKCGIVGLPNVGKSTLFNALTQTAAAQAANYPFCTIEPNVGEIAVPDQRLDTLAVLGKSEQIIPTRITFVDIAGLVRGAGLRICPLHGGVARVQGWGWESLCGGRACGADVVAAKARGGGEGDGGAA